LFPYLDILSALSNTTHYLESTFDAINRYSSCNKTLHPLILTKIRFISHTEHFLLPSSAT